MKFKLILSGLLIITITSFSQNKLSGFVIDTEGNPFPGAFIKEEGSDNKTTSGIDGKFLFNTINDTCEISFSYIGIEPIIIKVVKDTSIFIILDWLDVYTTKWFTIGANYDVLNSKYGLSVSNGYDEYPLIHFEEFQDSWLFKFAGTTDFEDDYSFDVLFGWDRLFRHFNMTTLETKFVEYNSNNFIYRDVNLSTNIWINCFPGEILFKTGYQRLNGEDNFGAAIGWQKRHKKLPFYVGLMAGYWFDYFTYKAYFQSLVFKYKLSLRAEYERIDEFNFATVGLLYCFNR